MIRSARLRRILANAARQITPPLIWAGGKLVLGMRAAMDYQFVRTGHSTRPLHEGRFAEIFERYQALDPYVAMNVTRLRIYNICAFARLCSNIAGDYAFVGVSFGVAARIVYEFTNFETLGKTFHLVDPFETIDEQYNDDVDYVRGQYPASAPIKFVQDTIPECLPIEGIRCLSFVHLNTGDWESEAKSLPYFYEALSAGGVIIVDDYAIDKGHFDIYDPVFKHLRIEPYWMPTGQCAIVKI